MPRFNEDETLLRFIETSANLIRAAHKGDIDMMKRALHQLVNIVSGWTLSAEINETTRQESLQRELDEQQED